MLSKTRDIFIATLRPSHLSVFSIPESTAISDSAKVLISDGYDENRSLLVNLLKRPATFDCMLEMGVYANIIMGALYTKYVDRVLKIILSPDPQEISKALAGITKDDISKIGEKLIDGKSSLRK